MVMAYRRAKHLPKGPWGRFLDRMRQERDWSAVQAHEALHEVLHLSVKSVAVYKAIESGARQVRPEEAEALREFFGKGPEDLTEVAEPAETGDHLARAIQALADELRAWRTEDRARIRDLEEIVATLAVARSGSGAGASPKRAAPRETAG